MSWIQENKFATALAGVTVVGSIALVSLSMSKGDAYEAAKSKLSEALSNEQQISSMKPYPNQENLDKKKAIVDDYAKAAKELEAQFAAFAPAASVVADFAPDNFSKIVSEYKARLTSLYTEQGVRLPDQCVFGFEAYASTFPRPEATGELNYQIQASEWLLSTLAADKPEALLNIVRGKLAIESAPDKPERGSRSRNAKANKGVAYSVMPMELAFRCDEKTLSKFLEELANSEKYPFMVRGIRVQNERQTPPTSKDAQFASTDEAASDSDGLDFGFSSGFGDAESEEPTAEVAKDSEVPTVASDGDSTRLLKPILGSEKVNVFLKLELILLDASAVDAKNAKSQTTNSAQ